MEASKGRPFFLYMATSAPHGDYFTDFMNVDPRYTPSGILEKRPQAMPPREELLDRVRAAGCSEKTAMSTWIDECLGAALGKLEELGVLDDTIAVFTCDHLARGKYMCYEGARVPFMIRWPGRIEPGTELSRICANIDLAATLCDLAGGRLPKGYETDGMSFAPLLLEPGGEHAWREHLMLEVSNIRGIVTDRWKYIANRASDDVLAAIEADRRQAEAAGRKRWVAWEGRRNPHAGYEREGVRYFAAGEFPCYFDPDQLYDLQSDVFEQSNLYGKPQYADIVDDLKRRLGQELRKLPHSFGEFA